MCRPKTHNLLMFLFFFVSFLGQSSANTKIAPGDRILTQGDQWVRNGTEGQLGLEVIRLSSFVEFSHIKRVSDNPNLKLFIGLAQAENIRTPAQPGAGRYLSLPTDMWPGYPTLTDSARVFLNAFRDTLHNWVHNEQLDIAAIMYNLEIPFRNLSKFSPPKNSREMSQAMTVLIKEYKAKIDSVTSNTDSDIELWVFGSKGDSLDASGKVVRDPITNATYSSFF